MPLGHLGIPLLVPIFGRRVDLDVRLLMLGALLPDIIDKPLGHLILPENNGRIFAHTLAFAAVVLILGFFWKPGLSLSLGVSFHHIQDGMFLDHRTSLWPLLGPFESYDFEVYQWFEAFGDPYVISEEVIGILILVGFIASFGLYRRSKLITFIRSGRIEREKNPKKPMNTR